MRTPATRDTGGALDDTTPPTATAPTVARPLQTRRRWRIAVGVVRIVGFLAAFAAAIAIAVIAIPLADYRDLRQETTRVSPVVAVVSRTTDFATPATLMLTWSPSSSISLRRASGVVTAVFVSDGATVGCGAPVVAIDGSARVAMCSTQPLYRPVSAFTRGVDADDLYRFVTGGEPETPVAATPAQRRAAFRAWQAYLGFNVTGTIDPGDVVWLDAPTRIDHVAVRVGMAAEDPAARLDIDAAITGATVLDSLGPELLEQPAHVKLTNGDVQLPLSADRAVADVAALTGLVRQGTADALVLPATQPVVVSVVTPVQVTTVPASAIVSGGGVICVRRASGVAVIVRVVASSVGESSVEGPLISGDQILAAPRKEQGCS